MAADKSKKLFQLGCTAPGMDMINAFMRGFVEGSVSPLIKRTMSNNGRLLAFDRLLSSVRDGHGVLPADIVLTMDAGAKDRTANMPAASIAHFCARFAGLHQAVETFWPELLLGNKMGTAAFYAVFAAINGGEAEIGRVALLFSGSAQVDASHLMQPDKLPGSQVEACETRFETHVDNANRIACRVLCEKQAVACCVCGSATPCKFWSHLPRAVLVLVV